MTASQLAKMQAAKQAANARRREQHVESVKLYLEWLHEERSMHEALLMSRDVCGSSAPEAAQAERDWKRTFRSCPGLPTDAAFALAREAG